MSTAPHIRRGFTLLEVIIALAIVGAIVGSAVPLFFEQVQADRAAETLRRLHVFKRGVVGNQQRLEAGSQRDFGFVGDMGRLPDSLSELRRQGGLPTFDVDPVSQLGAGWRGPYVPEEIAEDAANFGQDAFGREVFYSTTDTVVQGDLWAGFVRSPGSDGAHETPDDLVAPVREEEVRTDVSGFLAHGSGNEIAGAPVGYTIRRNGALKDTVMITDATGMWTAGDVFHGPSFLHASTSPAGQRMGFIRRLVAVTGGRDENVEFRVVNVTEDPVTITSMTATWNAPGVCYRRLVFDGVRVSGSAPTDICSGDTVTFTTAVSLTGGAANSNSISQQRFDVYQYVTPAPELVIVSGGTDAEALVEMRDFRDLLGSGQKVDMSGVTFTYTLSDGHTATFTTPSN